MSVTLEVLKLSGWLNASANCRESNGGRTMWGEVQSTGRPEVAGDRGPRGVACRRGHECTLEHRARGGAHVKHVLHVSDAGRVEAQRLVERRRELQSQAEARRVRQGELEGARTQGGGVAVHAVCTEEPTGH